MVCKNKPNIAHQLHVYMVSVKMDDSSYECKFWKQISNGDFIYYQSKAVMLEVHFEIAAENNSHISMASTTANYMYLTILQVIGVWLNSTKGLIIYTNLDIFLMLNMQ